MTARRAVRFVGLVAGALGGLEYALYIVQQARMTPRDAILLMPLCAVAGSIFGFFGLEYVTLRPFRWVESRLRQTPLADLFSALLGLTVGLVLAALSAYFVRALGYGLNIVVPAAMALLFGYWGVTIGMSRRDELLAMARGWPLERAGCVVLDTSVVIDGRLLDIARAGFISGRLLAPHFMLAELQGIADSAEAVRRARGRRGLDILEELRSLPGVVVEVTEDEFRDVAEVDHKLIRLAQQRHGSILTTDFNLNKVAHLEGISVMNINELANALKPALVPGEEMTVSPLKEGKESNQGVAYLSDGTMVVVEGGRSRIGQTVRVTVTSVIQTAAGRMIFAAISTSPAAEVSDGGRVVQIRNHP